MTRSPGFYRAGLPRARWSADRDGLLLTLVHGQRVLHVGCADAPLTEEKLAAGTLLHQRLLAASDDAVGVDIDAPALAVLRARLGGRYVRADVTDATDAAELMAAAASLAPTVILAADVLEHVGDPSRFLTALAAVAGQLDPAPRLVLSTPNALSLRGPVLAAAGYELAHPDHRAIYTPATLARALACAGFRPGGWHTYSVSLGRSLPRRVFDGIARTASRVRPVLADGLVVVASPVSPVRSPVT